MGVYAYGRTQPAELEVSVRATLEADAGDVWSLLSDPARRPEWRPFVDRIGKIDQEGPEIWRELDHGGDRFDFEVVERTPATPDRPARLVLQVSSVDQIGMEGRWHWEITQQAGGSSILITEHTAIANPLWRGLSRLTNDPFDRVETEVAMLADHLGSLVAVQRL